MQRAFERALSHHEQKRDAAFKKFVEENCVVRKNGHWVMNGKRVD